MLYLSTLELYLSCICAFSIAIPFPGVIFWNEVVLALFQLVSTGVTDISVRHGPPDVTHEFPFVRLTHTNVSQFTVHTPTKM
jgi:hypothetical protein